MCPAYSPKGSSTAFPISQMAPQSIQWLSYKTVHPWANATSRLSISGKATIWQIPTYLHHILENFTFLFLLQVTPNCLFSLLGPFNAFSSQWLSALLKTTNLTITHIEHFARTSHCTWNKITNLQIWSTKLNMIWPLFTLTVSFHVIQYPVCKLHSQLISFSPEGMKILPILGPSYTHAFTLSRYSPPLFIQLMSGFTCISKFSLSGTFSETSSLTHYLIGASLQSFMFIHSMFPNLYYRCFLH